MSAREWTDAHRREALRRTYELAAEQVGREGQDVDKIGELPEDADREEWWRRALADEFGLAPARIDREVRRVDGFATGRLVRETSHLWEIRSPTGSVRRVAELGGLRIGRLRKKGNAVVRVCVTRTRRARS